MRVLFSLSIIAAIVGSASSFKKPDQPKAFLSKPDAKVLDLRGGSLDTATVGKTFTALVGSQSVANILCPEAMIKTYGLSSNDENVFTLKGTGYAQLSAAAIAAQLFFFGSNVNTAVASGLIPFILGNISSLFNNEMASLGTKKSGNAMLYFWSSVEAIVAYGLFTNASWANTSLKLLSGLIAASGIQLVANPVAAFAQYGRKNVLPSDLAAVGKFYGTQVIIASSMAFALAFGYDIIKAIGVSSVPFVLYAVSTFFK